MAKLSSKDSDKLISILKSRFEKNTHRHKGLSFEKIQQKLEKSPAKLYSLNEMEKTGGEPDVIFYDKKTDEYYFVDCSKESPKDRRSLCYDRAALNSRKSFKPKNDVMTLVKEMGVQLLTKEDYLKLQSIENFDMKTSSWIQTPDNIRKLGGAIFADFRYQETFFYHNGADSYYAARGFRCLLKV